MSKSIWALFATAVAVSAASSPGCGQSALYSTGKLTAQWLMSDNQNRSYLVNLPKSYDSNVAAPLILSFHGNMREAKDQSRIDDFTNSTWNPNSIVVYPQGLNVRWTVYHISSYAREHIEASSNAPTFQLIRIRMRGKWHPMLAAMSTT